MRLFNRWSEARDKASGCSTLDARRRRRRSASLKRINVRIVEKLFRTVEARLEGGRLDRFSMTVSSPTGLLSFPRGEEFRAEEGGPRTISTSVSSRVSML